MNKKFSKISYKQKIGTKKTKIYAINKKIKKIKNKVKFNNKIYKYPNYRLV